MAALNLLLFELKLRDDVNDENSFIAKILLKFYGKQITKAKNDFTHLANVIKRGNQRIVENEKNNADALTVAENFALLMLDIAHEINPASEHKSIIKGVSMWLYVIDAIDDYEKDLKRGNFNPFFIKGKRHKSFSEYMIVNLTMITELFRTIYACFSPINSRNDLNILLYDYIPAITLRILKGDKMKVHYPLNKFKKFNQIETLEKEQFRLFVDSACDSTFIDEVLKSVEKNRISSIKLIQNLANSASLDLSIEQAYLQFDEWLKNGKNDIYLFSDIIKLIYTGVPHNCDFISCLGKCAHITAERQVTFCPKKQNGIVFNGQPFIEIFESDEFVNLLERTIIRREECKSQCVAFNVCGGGCPLKAKLKSDCDDRVQLFLHIKDKINNGDFNTFNKFVKNSIYQAIATGGRV
jgi:hypothetical protein